MYAHRYCKNTSIYFCIYVCVYGYIFNYSDKSVFGFSLVGDGGRRTARHSQRLSV